MRGPAELGVRGESQITELAWLRFIRRSEEYLSREAEALTRED